MSERGSVVTPPADETVNPTEWNVNTKPRTMHKEYLLGLEASLRAAVTELVLQNS